MKISSEDKLEWIEVQWLFVYWKVFLELWELFIFLGGGMPVFIASVIILLLSVWIVQSYGI